MNRIWNLVRAWMRLPSTPIGWLVSIFALVAVAGLGVWGYILYFPDLPSSVKVYDVVKLNKNWTDEERQKYYHTSQGSQVMPYDWFIALEQPVIQIFYQSVSRRTIRIRLPVCRMSG